MKKIILFLIPTLLILTQCKKEEVDGLEAAINAGGSFEAVEDSEQVTDSTSSEHTENGQRWRCTRKTVSITKGIGKGGFPMFNPNANVIYPGSLLQGKSLRNATPDVIAVDRAGGTISYDIIDGNDNSYFTVNEVKKSTVTDAMNQIIKGSSGVIPANFSFSYTNIQSRKQFALEVDADYENSFLELESHLELETDNRFNHYLVKLDQIYYTMSFDIPTNRSQLFAESVTAEDLDKYVGPGNPATYVSDVSYGRIYYMLIESTSSVFDMELAVSGSFQGIDQSGGGSIDIEYLNELDELKIKVFAYGGESSGTLQTINDIDPTELADKLAASGNIESGKPLSYVVRNVYDNKVVAMKVSTEYDIVDCVPVGTGNKPPAITQHWSGLNQYFGAIGAATEYQGDIILFNDEGTQYMVSTPDNQLHGPYELYDLGFNEAFPFDAVGAAGVIYYSSAYYRVFFNKAGNQYCTYVDGNLAAVYNLGDGPVGSGPFNAEGIGGIGNKNASTFMLFNSSGDRFYTRSSGGSSTAKFLYDIDITSECPFDYVGAACMYDTGLKEYLILFNTQGTQYCVYNSADGFSNVFDL